MNIIVKLEQKDFEGNKAVFDHLYELSTVLNRSEDKKPGEIISKTEIEEKAHIEPSENSAEETTDLPENSVYTIEQVRKAFGDLSKAKGKDTAKDILSEMGYTKVTEIPTDKYPEAMEKIKAVK